MFATCSLACEGGFPLSVLLGDRMVTGWKVVYDTHSPPPFSRELRAFCRLTERQLWSKLLCCDLLGGCQLRGREVSCPCSGLSHLGRALSRGWPSSSGSMERQAGSHQLLLRFACSLSGHQGAGVPHLPHGAWPIRFSTLGSMEPGRCCAKKGRGV